MKHTTYKNKAKTIHATIDEISNWIRNNLSVNESVRIDIGFNYDRTIAFLQIGKSLSQADKEKLITKYPELEGKEID